MEVPKVDAHWQPLLAGSERRDALEALAAIASDILTFRTTIRHCRVRNGHLEFLPVRNPSLASGTAGFGLFYHYLSAAHPRQEAFRGASDAAAALLREAVEATEVFPFTGTAGLFDGFFGVAWAAGHLHRHGGGGESALDDIDDLLTQVLAEPSWLRGRGNDLSAGLAGLAFYALQRLPRSIAVDGLERIVDELGRRARRSREGSTWLTDSGRGTVVSFGTTFAGRYVDLGVAHGTAGILAVLARIHFAGIRTAETEELVESGISWFLAHCVQLDPTCRIAAAVDDMGATHDFPGVAWCYGNLGVAAAVASIGRCLGRPDWTKAALDLARGVSERLQVDRMMEAGLCHGSAGVGHVLNRLYQATGDGQLRRAARSCFATTLALRRAGEGIGGYYALVPDPREPTRREWCKTPGLMSGSAGIGLALVAATSDLLPSWDELLLLGSCY